MNRTGNTFRVFISSTFSDLKVERDALQAEVYPRLRDLCAQYGAVFQAIDLRWGVSQEASRDQQTMNICLREIRRCQSITPRPNFIILLGDRYGWQPAPPQIPAEEYEKLLQNAPTEHQALFDKWYLRDDNAIPYEYCLQPWTCSYEEWAEIELQLHTALLSAAKIAGLPANAYFKYWASATHQEIMAGALQIDDADDHVHCFIRSINDISPDKQAEDFIDLDRDGNPDDEKAAYLSDLKNELSGHIPNNLHEYRAAWQGSGPSQAHIPSLCEDVFGSLKEIIVKQLGHSGNSESWIFEKDQHQAFADERSRIFVGREAYIQKIKTYLNDPGASHPLVVWGSSGSGKSALLAKVISDSQQTSDGECIIHRFIGATPDSTHTRSLLESLCTQIDDAYAQHETEKPSSLSKLISEFHERLKLASDQKPLILIVDALDQQSATDADQHLNWIPAEIPEHFHLVVSTTPGALYDRLQTRLPESQFIELGAMPPVEVETLLDIWLQEANRTLQDGQRQALLSKYGQCPLPLYLKLGFEQARRWKSYTPDDQIRISDDIQGVIRDLFDRLSLRSLHGEPLVSRSLAYLSAARHGLAEHEMLDVLALDDDVYNWFLENLFHTPPDLIRAVRAFLENKNGAPVSRMEVENWIQNVRDDEGVQQLREHLSEQRGSAPALRLPVVLWSRLHFDLEPYLNYRTVDGTRVISFYHRQIGEVATKMFLSKSQSIDRHRLLSEYFSNQELQIGQGRSRVANLRKLSEQPYQQTLSRSADALIGTLADYLFLETKTEAFGIHHVIEDYRRAIRSGIFERDQLEEGEYGGLETIMNTLLLASDAVSRNPAELPAQLLGRLEEIHENPIVRRLLEEALEKAEEPWLRAAKPTLISPFGSVLRSFYNHEEPVMDIAVLPDGRRLVTGSLDNTLSVIDLENGLELHKLQGHTKGVQRIAITPDGSHVVSASWDHTLKIWDLQTGMEVRTLSGHEERVLSVAISPDGERIVSGDWLGKVRIWNLPEGRELDCYSLHDGPIWDLDICHQGDICASGSEDKVVHVWEIDTGKVLHSFKGHTDKVFAVHFTQDGHRVVSGAWDGRICVWDLTNEELARRIHGNGGNVWCVEMSPDEKQVMAGLSNGLIKIWDVESGKLQRSLEGHSNWVSALAQVPDRNQLASGSFDHGVILWDLDREAKLEGEPIAEPVDHGVVWSVGVSLDTRHTYCTYYDGTLAQWSLETGEKLGEAAKRFLAKGGTRLDPAGQVMVQIFNHTQRSLSVQTLNGLERDTFLFNFPPYKPRQDRITTFAISRDRRRFAFGSENGNLEILDLSLKKEGNYGKFHKVLSGKRHEDRVNSIAITPDGKRAISASSDHVLKVWDLETANNQLASLEGHRNVIQCVSTSPDGRFALSGSLAGYIKVWDLESYEERLEFGAGESSIYTVLVSPDGKYVYSAGEDKALRIWDIQTGGQIAAFSEGGILHNIAISPDGETLVAGGDSRKLHILKIIGVDLGPPIVTSDRGVIRCPHCGKSFDASEDDLGTPISCPECLGRMELNSFTIATLEPNEVVVQKKPNPSREKPRGTILKDLHRNPLESKELSGDDIDDYLRKKGKK